MKNILILGLCLLMQSFLTAQTSSNMTLHSQYNPTGVTVFGGTKYNDVWGYTDATGVEYALVGTPDSVLIFKVNDCWTAERINAYSSGSTTLWRDIKTYSTYGYSVCDGSLCNEGLSIVDMNTVNNPTPNVLINTSFFTKAHNIYIDEANARLYAVGTPGSNMVILDISNPIAPSLVANVDFSVVSGLTGNFYVHDVYVKNNIAYCSHGNDSAWYAWDMSNITDTSGSGITLLKSVVTGDYNHSSWLSSNGNYAFFAEEVPVGRELGVIDLNTESVVKRFSDPLLATGSPTPHNPYVVGNDLFVSYYEDGLVVFDVTNPLNPVRKAYYDTFTNSSYSGYNGNWGVYPFFSSGCIVATDMTNGVHFLKLGISVPVEWLSFTARASKGRQVALQWSTATEINNDYFKVERSLDGKTFEEIARVEGAINSQETQEYFHLDEEPQSDILYYRIKQVDLDGQTSDTDIVSVDLGSEDKQLLVYPNPASDYLELQNIPGNVLTYRIVQSSGKVITSGRVTAEQNRVSLESVAAGNYILTVELVSGELMSYPVAIVK